MPNLKKSEMLEIYAIITAILEEKIPSDKKLSVKTRYNLLKNKSVMAAEVDPINQVQAQLGPFEQKRKELCEKWASKDANGNPVTQTDANGRSMYNITNLIEFNKELKVLQEESKEFNDYEKILNEEVNLNLFKINVDDLPNDLPTPLLERLLPILED